MESVQKGSRGDIEYSFGTQFGGPVDLNLNFGFFKFFQEIAGEFGEQFSQSVKEMKEFLKRDVPVTLLPEKVVSRFKATGPVLLEPQLKVIDGATPADVLKWLGIHKETMPISVHNGLTVPMENLLLHVMSKYTQLALPPWSSKS